MFFSGAKAAHCRLPLFKQEFIVLLKGRVIKGWGKSTEFWKGFPPEYKLLFQDFYPGTLNVKIEEPFDIPQDRIMKVNYPTFLFNKIWQGAKWRTINYLPARVNQMSGFLITLDPPSKGRPLDILDFILEGYVGEEEVEIEL